MFFLINMFLILGLFTIPYYIFPSGNLQPSHILLLFFSLLLFLNKKGQVILNRNLKSLILFVIYIFFVNISYALIYENTEFLMFNLYTLFNIIIYFCLSFFTLRYYDKVSKNITFTFISIGIVLFILWITGFGEYRFPPRYNGFFNDPNQMAFFVLCSMSICFVLIRSNLIFLIFFTVGSILIFATMSRSALLGLVLIIISYSVFFLQTKSKGGIFKTLALILCVGIFLSFNIEHILKLENVIIFLNRAESTDIGEQADVRGYTRVLMYPEYLLFGAGQGLDGRFNSLVEIHSTWVALFFYYGIIGLVLFLIFLWSIFKGLNLYQKMLFLAPMMYSFSTLGVRTSIFWIFLSIFYVVSIRNK